MTSIFTPEDVDVSPFDRRGGIRWQAVAWFLGVVVTALTTYNATASTFDKRITVLESQRDDIQRQLNDINRKLDRLLYRQ